MTQNADTGALCGDPTCQICPTQKDLDALHQRQQHEARDIVRSALGLPHRGALNCTCGYYALDPMSHIGGCPIKDWAEDEIADPGTDGR